MSDVHVILGEDVAAFYLALEEGKNSLAEEVFVVLRAQRMKALFELPGLLVVAIPAVLRRNDYRYRVAIVTYRIHIGRIRLVADFTCHPVLRVLAVVPVIVYRIQNPVPVARCAARGHDRCCCHCREQEENCYAKPKELLPIHQRPHTDSPLVQAYV